MSDELSSMQEAQITELIDADTELDLSKAGFSTPELVWTISEAKVEQKDANTRAVLEFRAENEGQEYKVTVREWLKHSNEVAQNVGQGNMKRLFKSALGLTTAKVNALQGGQVLATGVEDEAGFRRLKGIKAVPQKSAADAGAQGALAAL